MDVYQATKQVFHIITLAKINLTLINLLFGENGVRNQNASERKTQPCKEKKKILHLKCSLLLI